MSASAVQFRGVTPVIEAYEMNNVPNWALFCGKNIFGQYTDNAPDWTVGSQILSLLNIFPISLSIKDLPASHLYFLMDMSHLGDIGTTI